MSPEIQFDPNQIPPFETEAMKSPMERLLSEPEVIEELGRMLRRFLERRGVLLLAHGDDELVDRGVLAYTLSLTIAERIQLHYEFRESAKKTYLNPILESR